MTTIVSKGSTLSPLEKALKDSLQPREYRDVHMYAFTRRTVSVDGTVKIDHPLPVVAIGSILKESSEHFSKCESEPLVKVPAKIAERAQQC